MTQRPALDSADPLRKLWSECLKCERTCVFEEVDANLTQSQASEAQCCPIRGEDNPFTETDGVTLSQGSRTSPLLLCRESKMFLHYR